MKKYLYNCFIIIFCVMLFSACSVSRQADSGFPKIEILGIVITVDTNVTTKTEKIQFSITNYRIKDVVISPEFKIQKQVGESWEELPFLEGVSIPEYAIGQSNDWKPQSYILPVAEWYGYLSEGKYRLLIDVVGVEQVYSEHFMVEESH